MPITRPSTPRGRKANTETPKKRARRDSSSSEDIVREAQLPRRPARVDQQAGVGSMFPGIQSVSSARQADVQVAFETAYKRAAQAVADCFANDTNWALNVCISLSFWSYFQHDFCSSSRSMAFATATSELFRPSIRTILAILLSFSLRAVFRASWMQALATSPLLGVRSRVPVVLLRRLGVTVL